MIYDGYTVYFSHTATAKSLYPVVDRLSFGPNTAAKYRGANRLTGTTKHVRISQQLTARYSKRPTR